jgi:hypothetical protein
MWWWILLAALLGEYSWRWYSIDNHIYLIMYWVLACAVALGHSTRSLSEPARFLIAIVFSFATLWKCLAGQYFDGRFLHASFLTDPRLIPLGAAMSGAPAAEFAGGREALEYFLFNATPGAALELPAYRSLSFWTLVISWAGLAIEGLIAVLFWSGGDLSYRIRNALLIGFVGVAYFVFPVVSFAFVLGVMGLAQCRPDDYWTQFAYLIAIGVIQLTIIPWRVLLD